MSYGLNWSTTAAITDRRLFATVQGAVLPLGNDEALFQETVSGRGHVMTLQVLQALDLCRSFQTLDRHVGVICQQIEALRGQQTAVRKVLESLANREVLIEADAFVKQLASQPVPDPAPLGAVIIRTCNRPVSLQRCLASALVYEQRWKARRRYWVVDDSDDSRVVASNAERVRHFSEASDCEARTITRADLDVWFGRLSKGLTSSQQEFADHLLSRAPDSAPNLGAHYGRSMNWMTLLTAGSRAIWVDDDQLFDYRWHPQRVEGFQLEGALNAERVLASLGDATSTGRVVDEDPLELHLRWCGRSLADVLTVSPWAPKPEQWVGLAPSLTPTLQPGSRIVSTLHGHRGDSVTGQSDWIMSLPRDARAGWCGSRDSYLAGLQRPEVWQGSARAGLHPPAAITPSSVDGRAVLPAVPRRGRGEDALFAALTALMNPNGLQFELPMAIEHRRESNADRGDFKVRPARAEFASAVTDVLHERMGMVQAGTPQQRLRSAADLLQDFAAMPSEQCARWLQNLTASRRAGSVQRLQAAIAEDKHAAVYWLADARSLIEVNAKALVDPPELSLAGWPEQVSGRACVDLFQAELRDYAAALHVWPTLFEMALSKPLPT